MSPDVPKTSMKGRRALQAAGSLVAGALLLGLVLSQIDRAQLASSLARVRGDWLVVAVAAHAVASLLRGAYLGILAGKPRHVVALAATSAASHLAGLALPGPSADVSLAALVQRATGIPATHSVKVAGAVRVLEPTVRSALACIVALTVPRIAWVRYSISGVALVSLLLGIGVILRPDLLVAALRIAAWPFSRLARSSRKLAGFGGVIDRLLTLRDPAFLRRIAAHFVPLALARWVALVLGSFAIYRSVGAPLNPFQAAYVTLVSGYVMALPVRPPADLGTADVTHVALLLSLNLDQQAAATIVISTRCITLPLIALLGLAGFIILVFLQPPARDASPAAPEA
ncbi:MAG: flippase-like domain-containing protein [Armatimonadetes bacterium]|nr:flippase-like domain-containing protein [Armatimonadota bacterium]